jgi:hypothetical protein
LPIPKELTRKKKARNNKKKEKDTSGEGTDRDQDLWSVVVWHVVFSFTEAPFLISILTSSLFLL